MAKHISLEEQIAGASGIKSSEVVFDEEGQVFLKKVIFGGEANSESEQGQDLGRFSRESIYGEATSRQLDSIFEQIKTARAKQSQISDRQAALDQKIAATRKLIEAL